MGRMNRRGFLKIAAAVPAIAFVPAAAAGPELYGWRYEYFDCATWLGVMAAFIGPDGVRYRHAVRMPLPAGYRHRNDPREAYPEICAQAEDALRCWANMKWRKLS